MQGTERRRKWLKCSLVTLLMATMTQVSSADHHHHVFVFRHCVRSMVTAVNLYDADKKDESAFPTDITSYINVDLPNWETGEKWCTQAGSDHMKAVGQYLIQSDLLKHAAELQVEIITDVQKRDVTSALALAEGMEAGKAEGQTIHGLQELTYDATLFHPAKALEDTDMSEDAEALCDKPDENDLNRNIEARLQNVVRPSQSMHEAITTIEQYAGVGSAGSLTEIWTGDDLGDLNVALHKIKGPVNVVKDVAQTAFYAKASQVSPDFLPDLNLQVLMNLLAWHFWLRSVTDVGNVKSAAEGAAMVHRILQLLKHEDDPQSTAHHVTILMGHDSSLDSIATALDLRWDLPSPYPSPPGAEWFETPPGSALYFGHSAVDNGVDSHDGDNALVDMAFLAPILLEPNPDDSAAAPLIVANLSGALEMVPVEFHKPLDQAYVDGQHTRITDADPLQVLRDRLTDIVGDTLVYGDGPMQCYQNALAQYPDDAPPAATTTAPTAAPVDDSSTVGTPAPVAPTVATPAPQQSAASEPTAAPVELGSPQPTLAPFKAPTSGHHRTPPPIHYKPSQHPHFSTHHNGGGTNEESGTSPAMVGVVVLVVMGGLVFFLRKPIARGLGLGGQPIHYSGMDGRRQRQQHELDFSVEMI